MMARAAVEYGALNPELVARANDERIDPAALVPLPYDFAFSFDAPVLDGPSCVACGHPRWAHAVPALFWDGSCICGCSCPGGYIPGKLPDSPEAHR